MISVIYFLRYSGQYPTPALSVIKFCRILVEDQTVLSKLLSSQYPTPTTSVRNLDKLQCPISYFENVCYQFYVLDTVASSL